MSAEVLSSHFEASLDEMAEAVSAPLDGLDIEFVYKEAERDRKGPVNYEQIHGTVRVPDCEEPRTWTLNIPHELDSPYIHFIVPGFGGFKRSSRGLRNALSREENIASLSFDPVRKSSAKSDLLEAQKAHTDTVAAILQNLPNANELANVPNGPALDMGKVVFLPHSMGGLPAVEYSVNHPGEVSHMILLAIAGLESGKVGFNYLPRLLPSFRDELIPAIKKGHFEGYRNAPVMAWRTARYYGSNLIRTTGEIISLFDADLQPKLAAIGAMGIKLALFNFELDQLVYTDRVMAASGDLVDKRVIGVGMDHITPQTHPLTVALTVGRLSRELADMREPDRPATGEDLTLAA